MNLIHHLHPTERLFRANIFYDVFAKKSCRYAPVSFIMAFHPSVCPQTKLEDHRTDFCKMDRLTDQQKQVARNARLNNAPLRALRILC
jgi:hypothetical protein